MMHDHARFVIAREARRPRQSIRTFRLDCRALVLGLAMTGVAHAKRGAAPVNVCRCEGGSPTAAIHLEFQLDCRVLVPRTR